LFLKKSVTYSPSIAGRLRECIKDVRREEEQEFSHRVDNDKLIIEFSRYVNFPPNSIAVFSSLDAAYKSIISSISKSEDDAIIASPIESDFGQFVLKENRNVIEHYGESPFDADPSGIISQITSETKIIYLANPGRPSGTIYGIKDLELIIDSCDQAYLVLDELDFELCGIDGTHLLTKHDSLIIVRSLPRLLGMGETAGAYLISSPENIERVNRIRDGAYLSNLSENAAIAALRSLKFGHRDLEKIRENKILLGLKLRRLNIDFRITPMEWLLIKVCEPKKLCRLLKEHGISCRDLGNFRQLESFVALNVMSDFNSDHVIDILGKIPQEDFLSISESDNNADVLTEMTQYNT
jgi:histidinol-phosphate/aromatic aminotransferase/cobyric acid decarboxylase-like protein